MSDDGNQDTMHVYQLMLERERQNMYKFQSIAKTTNANLLGSITMYM
jgi:hypothetical protein